MSHSFTHPATYLARYLVLSQDDPGLAAVNRALGLLGLAELEKDQHAAIVREMSDVPADFRAWDRMHLASSRWLRAKKIYSMVHRDEATASVREIVENGRLREAVERMLIGGVGHLEIAFRLRDSGWPVSELAVADFRHYFWNTQIMGVGDWANYFAKDARGRTRELQLDYEAALMAGPQLALYRAGMKVVIDRKTVLEDVHRELVFTFQEVRHLPTNMKKVEMLSALARSIARVDERIEAGDSALQDVLKKFQKFEVIGDDEALPAAADLAPTGTLSDTSTRRQLTVSKKEGAK